MLTYGLVLLVGLCGGFGLAALMLKRSPKQELNGELPSVIRSSRSILKGTSSRERIMKTASRARFQ